MLFFGHTKQTCKHVADTTFKDLPRRTASDKVLRDKAFNIAINLKYNAYQRVLLP